jgi:hypothetical protein
MNAGRIKAQNSPDQRDWIEEQELAVLVDVGVELDPVVL